MSEADNLSALVPLPEQAEAQAAYVASLDGAEFDAYRQAYHPAILKAAMWVMTERLQARDDVIAAQNTELAERQHVIEAADEEIDFLEKNNLLDRLTGLGNRARLDTAYCNLMRNANLRRFGERPIGPTALMIDVDHFHDFNQAHGHPMGDVALRAVAAQVRDNVRDGDTAGRYGGEEIVVLLPETTEEEGWLVAERIRTSIEEAEIGPDRLHVTASIGVAPLEEAPELKDGLVLADQAMYAAKHTGRNRVMLSSDLDLGDE